MKKLVIFVLLSMLISSAIADVNFYASNRLGYWLDMMDKDMTGGESRMNSQFALYSTSRMGANFNFEKIAGKSEFGFGNVNNVYLRLANVKVDLGKMSLLVGQDYTGFHLGNVAAQSTSLILGYENMLLGYGAVYDGRRPMIKLIMKNGLYFAFMNPTKVDPFNLGTDAIDAIIPKINFGFNYKNDKFGVFPTFGLNMSKYNKDFNALEKDESVMAYVFATTFMFDMDKLKLKTQVNYGQNMDDYGVITSTFANVGFNADGDIVNATTLSGYLQVTFGKVTAGSGYITSSSDNLDDADTGMSAFLQGVFKLHKNVSIIPEVGLIDCMEDGMGGKEGSEMYFGFKMQGDIK